MRISSINQVTPAMFKAMKLMATAQEMGLDPIQESGVGFDTLQRLERVKVVTHNAQSKFYDFDYYAAVALLRGK